VYRFLLTARWLGLTALMLALAATMVGLGLWQLDRYHERSAINDRIDASAEGQAARVASILPLSGQPPPASAAWTRVTATGRYDVNNQVLVRGRTVNGQVGFEIVTPLVLADGSGRDAKAGGKATAVLVDRGWVAASASADAMALPDVPAPPTGQVSVAGRLHLTESRPGAIDRRGGWIETRRISVPRLAGELPYRLLGAYVLLDKQEPAADERLVPVPVEHENAWMNAGYVVQWWMFAALTLAGLVWLARREARGSRPATPQDRLLARASPDSATV
jgi:cytochrome oxidase assembly protein ShyY1